MTRKQSLILVVLLFSTGLTGWFLQRQDSRPALPHDIKRSPEFFVDRMKLKVTTEEGSVRYRIQADKMLQYPEEDKLELNEPTMQIIRPDSTVWHIRSERGQISTDGNSVFLLGKVEISRQRGSKASDLSILTSDILVKPAQETAETENRATVVTSRYRVESVGLHANFRDRQLELRSQVRGKFDVAG